MTKPEFAVTVYDHTVRSEVLDEPVALYREVYAEPPYLEGEDDFAGFADDLPHRARQENFRLVLARLDAEPLGFALGHQLPATTRWWDGAVTPLSKDVTAEYLGRTFAVIELAVLKPHRRGGLGRLLHAHLTADLAEERRALLVRPEADAAWAAYSAWGYRKVGQVRPSPGSPVYDAMIDEGAREPHRP